MKTSRRGSSRPWYCFHRSRRRATSGRSCSLACRLFFERDPFTSKEPPHRTVARRRAAFGQLRHHRPQGQVRLLGDPRQQPFPFPLQQERAPAPHLRRRHTPRRPPALTPLHNAGNAHPKQRRRRPARTTRRHRTHNSISKIRRIGSRHRCWPPTPASILNQKFKPVGIPFIDSAYADHALGRYFPHLGYCGPATAA